MLVPYDPRWPDLFRSAAADIHELGSSAWVIEHIGSTAVPGMTAKPIIDLAVRVEDERDFRRHRPGLERGGWHTGSSVRSHPVMVREVEGTRTHIAHFFERRLWPEVNQRLFRDWLLSHPRDARDYEAVKRSAADASTDDGVSYNEGKTAVRPGDRRPCATPARSAAGAGVRQVAAALIPTTTPLPRRATTAQAGRQDSSTGRISTTGWARVSTCAASTRAS